MLEAHGRRTVTRSPNGGLANRGNSVYRLLEKVERGGTHLTKFCRSAPEKPTVPLAKTIVSTSKANKAPQRVNDRRV